MTLAIVGVSTPEKSAKATIHKLGLFPLAGGAVYRDTPASLPSSTHVVNTRAVHRNSTLLSGFQSERGNALAVTLRKKLVLNLVFMAY